MPTGWAGPRNAAAEAFRAPPMHIVLAMNRPGRTGASRSGGVSCRSSDDPDLAHRGQAAGITAATCADRARGALLCPARPEPA